MLEAVSGASEERPTKGFLLLITACTTGNRQRLYRLDHGSARTAPHKTYIANFRRTVARIG